MIRRIIEINETKCDGCGICVNACHEGAIGIKNNKAVLLRDDYCDGLGDCLPTCPQNAISFIEREALEYDDIAVKENQRKKQEQPILTGCPGSMAKAISHTQDININAFKFEASALRQWPVQIKLAPINAPYFDGADLLIAADCTAYAYANFHGQFMKNKVTLIGCPKLDMTDYSEKLTQIIRANDIQSIAVTRMEVPCCSGIEIATKTAIENSGKIIPLQVTTISLEGKILKLAHHLSTAR